MTAHETVRLIRERFPEPMKSPASRYYGQGRYCVGGAAQEFHKPKWGYPFPGVPALSRTLREMNPRLDYETGFDFAVDIINANDRGDFEVAWAALEEALAYGETT